MESPITLLERWHEQVPERSRRQGTYYGALVVLENLIEDFQLGPEQHFTDAGTGGRIARISAARVAGILGKLDSRIVVNEYAGRTSTGPTKEARRLLLAIADAHLDKLAQAERAEYLMKCQRFMCDRLWDLQTGRPILLVLDPSITLDENLSLLLEEQRESGRDRALAQHLVGAKLELRFPRRDYPEVVVNRDSVDAADTSRQKPGDFDIGDTVYHVTVAFNMGHIRKCEENLRSNLRPMLLVPTSQLNDAAVAVKLQAPGRIRVRSIECFVSDNMEELAIASYPVVRDRVRELVNTYNIRIDEAETGKPYLRMDASRL